MFKKNIRALKYNEYHEVTNLNNSSKYPLFISKKYSRETFQLESGDMYHSKVEMDSKTEISALKKEVIFIFGINAVEEIKWVQKKKHPESVLVIIEPNPSFFSYAINNKDLTEIFKEKNTLLFVEDKIDKLNIFLQKVFYNFDYLKYLKNTNVYLTHYYRENELQNVKNILVHIRQVISTLLFGLGNDLQDNLIGLERNVNNIDNIMRSKDIIACKDLFKSLPAVVVAAGPSLNKNIEELKLMKQNVIIIAVDTIAQKLISEGIEPHFICSIERVPQVYYYFYENLILPKKSVIVGPPVLDNRIFKSTNNTILIPFRKGIAETTWLQNILGLSEETAIPMGYSCANVAFSLGSYLGCNPIILVGQDLAYGKNETDTHASGTKYDELDSATNKKKRIEYTEGYFGEKVKTTKIWLQFKHWLENEINNLSCTVINATEGGAKINFAQQLPLKEVRIKYCKNPLKNIQEKIERVPQYDINQEQYLTNLINEIHLYDSIEKKCIEYQGILSSFSSELNTNQITTLVEGFQLLIDGIVKQPLLLHNLQSVIMQYYWAYHSRLQVFDREYVKEEIEEQQKLINTIIEVIGIILKILKSQENIEA